MREQLPIFPLNTVVFPGVRVPLHVFEDRYRALVHHLLTIPSAAVKPRRSCLSRQWERRPEKLLEWVARERRGGALPRGWIEGRLKRSAAARASS